MPVKQPEERKNKKILVSVWNGHGMAWSLVSAEKRGDHYVIAPAALTSLINKAGLGKRGDTFVIG